MTIKTQSASHRKIIDTMTINTQFASHRINMQLFFDKFGLRNTLLRIGFQQIKSFV